jgi:TRAP-type C4-dicarboxylate transport system permease small subunit
MTGWSRMADTCERVLLAVPMLLICLLLLVQTGSRSIGSAAFGWAEEAARYLFIWVVFLGSGFAVRHGGHILADVLLPKSNNVLATVWLVVLEAVLAATSFLLLWYGAQLIAITSNSAMISIDLSMAYRSAAVPAGAALMFVFSLGNIAVLLRRMRRPADAADTAPPRAP